MRKGLAWAIGIVATIALLFGIYAWTIVLLGVHLPFSRRVPVPAFEWLIDVSRLLNVAALAIVTVALLMAVIAIRRGKWIIDLPRWAVIVAVLLALAIVAEFGSQIWVEYLLDRPDGIEESVAQGRTPEILQYVGIVAGLVSRWSIFMLIAGAMVRSERMELEPS